MAVFQNNIYSNLKNKRDAVDMSKTGLLCSFYKSFHFHMGRVAEQLGIQLEHVKRERDRNTIHYAKR